MEYSASGNSALLEAVIFNDEAKVRYLINAGANVFVVNNGGETGLHLSVLKGNLSLVRVGTLY